MSSSLIAEEQKKSLAALIIDKENVIGEQLANRLEESFTIVFLTQQKIHEEKSFITIPLGKTVPSIPDALYSYIFFVWHEETKEFLEPIVKKAGEIQAKLLLIFPNPDVFHKEELPRRVEESTVEVVLGDLFSTPQANSPLDKWINQTKKTKKIKLPHMGLTTVAPVMFQDALDALLSIALAKTKEDKPVLLYTKHPFTHIALAHAIQKIDPTVRTDFIKDEEKLQHSRSREGKHILSDEYAVEEKIQAYYQSLPITDEQKGTEELYFSPSPQKTKKQRKVTLPIFFLYTILTALLMPFLLFVVFGALGAFLLRSSVEDVQKGQINSASNKANASKADLQLASYAALILGYELAPIGQQHLFGLQADTAVGQTVAKTVAELSEGLLAFQHVLQGQTLKPADEIQVGVTNIKSAYLDMTQIQDLSLPQVYRQKFSTFKNFLQLAANIVDMSPTLLTGDKTYAFLFQNNMELRPGGGFIGSYGILKLHNGKIENFTTHNVYDADGQLKGHIEPPFALRRYMPIVHLYLRDSNFDVDFAKDGAQAAQLLNDETGDRVDGVIGMDLSFVQNIIGAMNKVYVPSYNETITADNFFLSTEKHAEKNSFAGSTQKQDFLQALFSAMQNKVANPTGVSGELLLSAIEKGLEEKHILLSFSDPLVQQMAVVNGFSSSLWDGRSQKGNILNDFLGINEANIGVDKANYFVKRSVNQKVTITDKGNIQETVTLSLVNNSPKGQWPGGVYRNYLRFILPKDSILLSVLVNNIEQHLVDAITQPSVYEAKNFKAPNGLEIEKTQESDKNLYGFLVTIPEESSSTVTISYTLKNIFDVTSASSAYSLKLFKQPGVDSIPYVLTIDMPSSLSIVKSSQHLQESNGMYEWIGDITKDTIVDVMFAKK